MVYSRKLFLELASLVCIYKMKSQKLTCVFYKFYLDILVIARLNTIFATSLNKLEYSNN